MILVGSTLDSADTITPLIDRLRAGIAGELSGRSRVIDHLLDVRLAAAEAGVPSVVDTVDRLLVELPGRTTVANSWWWSALDELAAATSSVPTGPIG